MVGWKGAKDWLAHGIGWLSADRFNSMIPRSSATESTFPPRPKGNATLSGWRDLVVPLNELILRHSSWHASSSMVLKARIFPATHQMEASRSAARPRVAALRSYLPGGPPHAERPDGLLSASNSCERLWILEHAVYHPCERSRNQTEGNQENVYLLCCHVLIQLSGDQRSKSGW